jgi:phage terminase large subunit
MPELRTTTYKTFLEICPPELIAEHKVAESQVKIKSINGKFSWIYFRQLEEPDKLRSLNLSGFYIDEANQCTEEAFMLLQGRLRGSGIRKGILTTNPKGHDWIYKWFFKKDHIKDELVKSQYHLIKAPSTENIHLPEDYLSSMMTTWSKDRIQREIDGSFDAFEGMIYDEFRRDVHVIQPFRIPESWERHIRIDHGYRNPCSVGFYAMSPDGEIYKYRQMYVREWLIEDIVKGRKDLKRFGILDNISKNEKFASAKIDPSVKATRGRKGGSEYDEYLEYWPKSDPRLPPLQLAQNDVKLGIQRVKSYLKVRPEIGKPMFFVFSTCEPTIEEFTTYQWEEQTSASIGKKNDPETPKKVNDHAMDETRYMLIDCPEPNPVDKSELERLKKYSSIEIRMQNELRELKKPKEKGDPFQDGI